MIFQSPLCILNTDPNLLNIIIFSLSVFYHTFHWTKKTNIHFDELISYLVTVCALWILFNKLFSTIRLQKYVLKFSYIFTLNRYFIHSGLCLLYEVQEWFHFFSFCEPIVLAPIAGNDHTKFPYIHRNDSRPYYIDSIPDAG